MKHINAYRRHQHIISQLDELSEYLQEFFDMFNITESTLISITDRPQRNTWTIDYITHTLCVFTGNLTDEKRVFNHLKMLEPQLSKRMGMSMVDDRNLSISKLKAVFGVGIKIID